MKIVLLQENLRSALASVGKAVPSKPQLSVLSSILLRATESGLELAATDLYFGIRTTVLAEVEETGALLIPGKLFLESIQSLSAGKITLETDKTVLKISSANTKLQLNGQTSEDFPAFPTKDGLEYVMPLTQLEEIDQFVRFSVGTDPTRQVLTALLFNFQDQQLQVVGTDGFRLSVLQQSLTSPLEAQRFLIPARVISEVVRIMGQEKVENATLFLSHDMKQVSFALGQTEVFVRLIEGDYPPFEKIMPADFLIQASWDGEEFAAQLKLAMIFARETSNIIKFEVGTETLTLSATSTLQGNFTGTMPLALHKGEPSLIAFNARYLMDFITNVKPQQIWFGMNESLKPALLRPDGKTQFTYVVMPFRVNDGG